MTCPADGTEAAGTWHCAQRWAAIRGMIGFRNAVAGTFTATVAKGSAVALYAGATPANWTGHPEIRSVRSRLVHRRNTA